MNGTAQPAEPAPGTAEQLARIAYFRGLEQTQPEELDEVALFLLGSVPDRRALWKSLRPDCQRLWHLITDDWDERDLDELDEWFFCATPEQAESIRYERTRERLVGEIEQTVWLARYRATEAARTAVAS